MNDLSPLSGANSLHSKLTVVDGLIVSKFGRDVFEDMRRGGITAANCTCCIWEDFTATMRNIMQWKAWFRDNADLILQVRTTADIRRARLRADRPRARSAAAKPRMSDWVSAPSVPGSAGVP